MEYFLGKSQTALDLPPSLICLEKILHISGESLTFVIISLSNSLKIEENLQYKLSISKRFIGAVHILWQSQDV